VTIAEGIRDRIYRPVIQAQQRAREEEERRRYQAGQRTTLIAAGATESTALAPPLAAGPDGIGMKSSPCAWSWAALMHRTFAMDVLACSHCGGRLRPIATLHDPAVIRKILAHLDLSHSGESPGPAPPESGVAAS
jgi:hypothetical protein